MNCKNKCYELKDDMRIVWLQHVYWTRLVIISIIDRLDDQPYTIARLLENPKDLASIYAHFYSDDVARKIDELFTEHLKIGGDLITATRDGDKEKAAKLDAEWYANAEAIAKYFSSFNPYYDYNVVKKMMFTHLDLTKKEVGARLSKNYPEDINAFAAAEHEIMMMGDMFTKGIIQQFQMKC